MKRYKINYIALTSALLLLIFALVFAKIIPGGDTLKYIILILMTSIALISWFLKPKKKH